MDKRGRSGRRQNMKNPNSQEPVAPGGCERDHTTGYFTVDEVAERYRVSKRLVYEALSRGGMGGFKIGGSWRVSEAALQAFEQRGGFRRPKKFMNRPTAATTGRRRSRRTIVNKIAI